MTLRPLVTHRSPHIHDTSSYGDDWQMKLKAYGRVAIGMTALRKADVNDKKKITQGTARGLA